MGKEAFFSSVRIRRDEIPGDQYPLSIPAVRQLEQIRFHPSVTIIAGENGAGKSTIVEAIAVAAGFNAEGGRKSFMTCQQSTDLRLADSLTLVRGARREQDGFFLRGESAYALINYINDVDPEVRRWYGGDLHKRSHGESFMQIFQKRFGRAKEALFILDELESALSPQRQLEFLVMMHSYVQAGCQFIVSTHSPILMSYPESTLYWLDENGITTKSWTETDHYTIYRSFLEHPCEFHKRLFSPD